MNLNPCVSDIQLLFAIYINRLDRIAITTGTRLINMNDHNVVTAALALLSCRIDWRRFRLRFWRDWRRFGGDVPVKQATGFE